MARLLHLQSRVSLGLMFPRSAPVILPSIQAVGLPSVGWMWATFCRALPEYLPREILGQKGGVEEREQGLANVLQITSPRATLGGGPGDNPTARPIHPLGHPPPKKSGSHQTRSLGLQQKQTKTAVELADLVRNHIAAPESLMIRVHPDKLRGWHVVTYGNNPTLVAQAQSRAEAAADVLRLQYDLAD
jgi:hypothetical protein